jgi:hypothetical protein
MSDAGSLSFDEGHADGVGAPAAVAEWARSQPLWAYGSELDFSDGVTSVIVLGGEVNAANAAWQLGPIRAAATLTRGRGAELRGRARAGDRAHRRSIVTT